MYRKLHQINEPHKLGPHILIDQSPLPPPQFDLLILPPRPDPYRDSLPRERNHASDAHPSSTL